MPGCVIEIPMRLASEANRRDHWRQRHRRRRVQMDTVAVYLIRHRAQLPTAPGRVRIIRRGPMRMDTDNNTGAMKHVQDAIARCFGVDDGDPRWRWEYEQEIAAEYSVVVRFG